jgi:hypothetical protein
MFEKLEAILAKVDADYADIRYEIKTVTLIEFNGRDLTAGTSRVSVPIPPMDTSCEF